MGALAAAGSFFETFYRPSVWQPAALLTLLALAAAVVSVRRFPRGWALVSLAGLALLLVLGALSMTWAESVDRAWLESLRLVLYLAFFALALCLVRDRVQGFTAMAAVAAATAAVVIVVEIRLFGGSGPAQFSGYRLAQPVGYVNGMAGTLLIGVWLFVGVAERLRAWWAQTVLMALTTLAGCLLVLTQARAILPALAVSVAVCLVPPGRVRRAWFLTFALAGIASALPWLLDVYAPDHRGAGPLPLADPVHGAATASLVMSLAVAAAWGVVTALTERLTISRRAHTAAATGLMALVVTAVALVVAFGHPVSRAERAADDFMHLRDPTISARFTSGGGYRADLWRIAFDQFERKPLTGIGLGNYELPFVQERRHSQYVKQPHSLELQFLSELGILGLLAFALFVVGIYGAAWQARAADPSGRAVLVAGVGAFTVWLVHTSVDWLYNLPSITGIALLAAAAVASLRPRPNAPLPYRVDRIVRLVAVCALALAAAGVGRHWAADLYRDDGQRALADDPVKTLERASASLQLNPSSLESRYVAAAAYARIGRYDPARVTLLDAARLEPSRYEPWASLGDLAARKGRLRDARRYYTHAAELNPLEKGLRDLARHPLNALK